jgi:hypothetical protein
VLLTLFELLDLVFVDFQVVSYLGGDAVGVEFVLRGVQLVVAVGRAA